MTPIRMVYEQVNYSDRNLRIRFAGVLLTLENVFIKMIYSQLTCVIVAYSCLVFLLLLIFRMKAISHYSMRNSFCTSHEIYYHGDIWIMIVEQICIYLKPNDIVGQRRLKFYKFIWKNICAISV